MTRLAVVVSHPIQYLSPWWAHLAATPGIELKVFYLWDFGVELRRDVDFGEAFRWDIPLLDGYQYEFVANISSQPGTHRFGGLDNPALVAILASWRPDAILLCGYAYLSHFRLIGSRKLAHVPFILRGDSHNLGRPPGPKTAALRFLRQLVFRRMAAFLAVGRANTEYFAECASATQRIFQSPHFVDNARFQRAAGHCDADSHEWRRRIGIDDDAFVFGFVGKLEARKRPWDLLLAAECLTSNDSTAATRPAVTLFVGAGAELSRLQEMAGARIGRDVFFAPFQNQTDMPGVYSSIDVLVLPSGSETWGLGVNEAMNRGVPAIVSDVVGCGPDLIVPGVTGWISRTGDIDDLRRALQAALDRTDAQRVEMAAAVRRHVASHSVESATAGLLNAIDWVGRRSRSHGAH